MHRFDGCDIELTGGDSLVFFVDLEGRELPDGAVALFTVKQNPKDDTPLIEKELEIKENRIEIALSSEETDLPARTYYWDLRTKFTADYGEEVETPMEYAALTIIQPIGDMNRG